jgi:hypothetical protein
MTLRTFLLAAALINVGALSLTSTHANRADLKSAASTSTAAPPEALVLPQPKKLNQLQKAYLDSYCILSQRNSCSALFGGPQAIHALNGLVKQLRTTVMDKGIVIKMGGETIMFRDGETGFSYRLFGKAELNLIGAFYQGNNLPTGAIIPRVGRFEPNTREARVTVLLHELGHLVHSQEGGWLLPDDGYNTSISQANTDRIIAACGEQITGLRNFTFEQQLMAVQSQRSPNGSSGVTDSATALVH